MTTWVNLEDIMPNEVRQVQKNKHCVSPLIEGTKTVKSIESQSGGLVVDRAWWEGEKGFIDQEV